MKLLRSITIYAFFGLAFIGFMKSELNAKDYVFRIPIELRQIHPDLTEWLVKVDVYLKDTSDKLNSSSKVFTVHRNYFGTIEVRIFTAPVKDRKPKWYRAYLMAKEPGARRWQLASWLFESDRYQYDKSKEHRYGTTGNIIE